MKEQKNTQARELLNKRIDQGWLIVLDLTHRGRKHGLDEAYQRLV